MTYRVSTGDSEGRATHWFASFLSQQVITPTYSLQDILDKHNTKATCHELYSIGDPLEFESEQDFLIFVMKWS